MRKKLLTHSVLNKSATNREDLYKICRSFGLRNTKIEFARNFSPRYERMILNLGNPISGGSHWVAVDNVNKRYFDPFGMNPPTYIPKDYEWTPLSIQNINYGHCGQYCCLFLYYSKMNEIDKLYNLFEIGSMGV